MRTLFQITLLSVLCLLSSGCITNKLGKLNTGEGAAGVVKSLRPGTGPVVDKIADYLVGKRVNPVENFTYDERWFYQDEEINPADLRRTETYTRDFGVVAAFESTPTNAPASPSDEELRAEIRAILNAAGVNDE